MSETPKQAEFRAMLTRATNTSFDCGAYEFYAGEPVEENYGKLAEKASAAHAKVIEMYAELERENARLRDRVKNQSERLRFLEGPTNHAGGFRSEYYVAYTLREGPPIMQLDAFKTHELAVAFTHELNESRRAFSVAGVFRFAELPT